MKSYAYTAQGFSGETVKGVIRAETLDEFKRAIYEKKLYLVQFNEVSFFSSGIKYRMKTKELAFLCRQLSSMLNAGLTLDKALDTLYADQTNKKMREVLSAVGQEVQKENALSKALVLQEGVFPELLINMVMAGEAGGSLDVIMAQLSEHYAKENKTQNKIKSAITYPIILCLITAVMVLSVFTFIIPAFMELFEGTDIPALTRVMLNISNFVRTRWYILILVSAGLVVLFRFAWHSVICRIAIEKAVLSIPKIGKLIIKIYTGRFARTLSLLYASGIPMVDCLEKSVHVLSNTYMESRFRFVTDPVPRRAEARNRL